jgi:hypothetical protein
MNVKYMGVGNNALPNQIKWDHTNMKLSQENKQQYAEFSMLLRGVTKGVTKTPECDCIEQP